MLHDDDRSDPVELAAPTHPRERKPRTLAQAVEAYWERVTVEVDGPRADASRDLAL
jgi:hypothetical protein